MMFFYATLVDTELLVVCNLEPLPLIDSIHLLQPSRHRFRFHYAESESVLYEVSNNWKH